MDSVNPAEKRSALRQKVSHAQNALQSAASASFLKGDPLAEQLKAMSVAIGVMTDLHEASQETQIDIAETLKSQSDAVTREAIARVEAAGAELALKIGPEIAAEAKWTMRQEFKVLRMRSIGILTGILLAVVAVPSAFTYAAGLNNGRTQGEDAANTIGQAMHREPAAAAVVWAQLMDLNNPVPEMALCRQSITTAPDGSESCEMPVWIKAFGSNAPQH